MRGSKTHPALDLSVSSRHDRNVFTGITRGLFEVVDVKRVPAGIHYTVDLGVLAENLAIGASVGIDGVCQSVVAIEGTCVSFDAVGETLSRTTLDALEPGRRVSVERSLRAGDEIGGHEVSGHVMTTGRVVEVDRNGGHALTIEVDAAWGKYLMEKGFIAVDGSSLTLGKVESNEATTRFSIHLIPETLRVTSFADRRPGDRVNIEFDARTVAIVETVERVLAARAIAQTR